MIFCPPEKVLSTAAAEPGLSQLSAATKAAVLSVTISATAP